MTTGQQTQHFGVGQIIYILSNKSQTVVPAIVAEENVHKVRKLNGTQEIVTYKVAVGPKSRQKVVELNQIEGEVFTSIEDIRNHLVLKLTAFVDMLVKETTEKANQWFDVGAVDVSGPGSSMGPKLDPEQIINAVDNNRALPSVQNGQLHPLQIPGAGGQNHQEMSLQEKIRNAVTPEEEDAFQGLANQPTNQRYAILPDGTKVPIKG